MKRPLSLFTACLLTLVTLGLPLGGALTAPAAADTATKPEKTELIDINSASRAALAKLPGVGEATADRIIAGRPWKSKYDLVVKKVVARSTYDKFSKYIVARQPSAN